MEPVLSRLSEGGSAEELTSGSHRARGVALHRRRQPQQQHGSRDLLQRYWVSEVPLRPHMLVCYMLVMRTDAGTHSNHTQGH